MHKLFEGIIIYLIGCIITFYYCFFKEFEKSSITNYNIGFKYSFYKTFLLYGDGVIFSWSFLILLILMEIIFSIYSLLEYCYNKIKK